MEERTGIRTIALILMGKGLENSTNILRRITQETIFTMERTNNTLDLL